MGRVINRYQVVIIGAGVAGCATALALLKQGIRSILIVSRPETTGFKAGETLQPLATGLLDELGLLEDFQKTLYLTGHGSCSAWGSDELVFNDNILRLHGHGYALDRLTFDRLFFDKVESKGITILNDSLVSLEKHPEDQWLLQLKTGGPIKSSFIVDATGRQSYVARQLHVPRIQFDDLHAVYTFWRGQSAKFSRHSFVESVENGWCYTAALPNDIFALAIFTDKSTIKQYQLKEITNFRAFLEKTQHSKHLLTQTSELIQMSLAVANSSMLDRIGSNHGWLAVGDAASAYDPLSAIGIAKAMADGLNASDAISQWFNNKPKAIESYAQQVQTAFNEFLKQRYRHYSTERRWTHSPFWKSRQEWTSVHPERNLIRNQHTSNRLRDRVLSSLELQSILTLFNDVRPAHEAVRAYQNHTGNTHPDWKIIQAIGYLINNDFLIAA
ncbi:MAG: hypothetical protein HEP71_33320 [Roseivirga sp.]|nr:hypothetical protein [Roseivirga sp.]